MKIWILFPRGKTTFYSLAALVRKILFCHSKIKFISSRHRVISSIYYVNKSRKRTSSFHFHDTSIKCVCSKYFNLKLFEISKRQISLIFIYLNQAWTLGSTYLQHHIMLAPRLSNGSTLIMVSFYGFKKSWSRNTENWCTQAGKVELAAAKMIACIADATREGVNFWCRSRHWFFPLVEARE